MINLKQEELIKKLVKDIQKKFPEIQFININRSPENPNEIWVNMTAPENEDREFELREYSADLTTDILLDYGYHILIMLNPNEDSARFWPSVEFSLEEN